MAVPSRPYPPPLGLNGRRNFGSQIFFPLMAGPLPSPLPFNNGTAIKKEPFLLLPFWEEVKKICPLIYTVNFALRIQWIDNFIQPLYNFLNIFYGFEPSLVNTK